MATITLTPQRTVQGGAAVTRTGSLSIADTFKFRNDGKTVLLFEKTGAGACTVSVVTPKTEAGLGVADQPVTVPASTGDVACGPFPKDIFNDGNDDVSFTISEATGLNVAVLSLP